MTASSDRQAIPYESEQREIDAANRAYWAEPCGTTFARSIGIVDITPEALAVFDRAYFGFYPYLVPMLDRIPAGRVLEIGLGYGTVTSYLAPRVSTYHGIDIAEEPVGLARMRVALLDRDPDLIQQGSALALPFDDGSFDAVVTIGTLHHTGDMAGSIAEVRRVLRPGGTALVMIYNAWSFRRLLHWRDRPERLRGRFDNRTDGSFAPHTDFTSPPAARRLFAGFASTRIEIRNFDSVLRTPRRLWLGNVDRVLGVDLYITAVK